MEKISNPSPPHVIIFPFPVQGHVNSMLKLSEILSLAGIHVTFVNTQQNEERLFKFTDIQARFKKYSGFRFMAIQDGMNRDSSLKFDLKDLLDSMERTSRPEFKQLLADIRPRVDCIIGDGVPGFILEIAVEVGMPIILFRTISGCCFWVYFCILDMIQAGELPIRGEEDMDRLITKVPGMETFLRCRDLSSFCRTTNMEDYDLQVLMNVTRNSPQAQALILNTFEDLEGPILSQIRNHCPKLYSIGPLHELLNSKLKESDHQSPNSLWEVDRNCMTWLDRQVTKSVIYISFGSITIITQEQFIELWHGIVNSKIPFLWVIRPDSITNINHGKFPEELLKEGEKENGYIVKWAPQEEVLAHKSVGGFLTHSGWNLSLESIVSGVPMICWPYFADQQVNSRFVSEIWNLGLDMKDVCDRKIVEKMVNDLMVNKRDEFVKFSSRMAELARKSVSEGGSSWRNLDRLIEHITMISMQGHHE
ncbi:7-deoxyloganetic acid glucosyl transferase-like [Mercurialis annua]|uniref:7-deoxyloganetic acid glucosyl transferase-like n=1 Tax=Mercurialis annua TaxID=3986 RepID=UPI00215F7D0E|nr:7-deoxyloganetic acid glucosyl transferase-like [Mercurialis annua]